MARTSKAQIRRLIAAANAPRPAPSPLTAELEAYLETYEPRDLPAGTWPAIKPTVIDWMRRYAPTSSEATRQRVVATVAFLAWAHGLGWPLDETLLTYARIDAFADAMDVSESTRANYRSRLRGMLPKVNPPAAVSTTVPLGHRAVKPPYTAAEVASIIAFARTQPTATSGRQVAACVGLGLGAGLDSVDLRLLERRHVVDHGGDGILVQVPGRRAREVWVRQSFEGLVRTGISGLRPEQLVIGEVRDRRGIAGKVYERAEAPASVVHIEQARLRTTWLAALLLARLPLVVIMDAAGLTSARTLTELVPLLDLEVAVDDVRGVR